MRINENTRVLPWAPTAMAVLGSAAAALLALLRVALMPLLRDADTGRFATNVPAVAVALLTLLALLVLSLFCQRERADVPTSRALPASFAGLLAGGMVGAVAAYDVFRLMFGGILPPPGQVQENNLSKIILYGLLAFGVLGAVYLVRFGLQIASEGGTRRGMSAFGALAPVMWAWCRLAWYEMSYTGTIAWSEKFYDFLMVIFELLFLFKLARFTSGVGKTTTGGMLLFSFAAALFSLSGPLTGVGLYFIGGAEAYSVSHLAGIADAGIGVLALAVGWALVRGMREQPPIEDDSEEYFEEEDNPYDSSMDSLFVLEENEASEYNRP